MTISKITPDNINLIKDNYNKFCTEAITAYKFDKPPLRFDELISNIKDEFLEGYLDEKGNFLFYSDKINEAIELNLIYGEYLEDKVNLLKAFLKNTKTSKVISYPLMGEQNDMLDSVEKIGFGKVKQCYLKLKVNDRYNMSQIDKAGNPSITIKKWDNKYIDEVSNLIFEAFKNSNDAKFDTRFLSFDGAKSIVENIISSNYGPFNPEFTALSFDGEKVTGVCFMTFSNLKSSVVPIVAVLPEYANQGIGSTVLKWSLLYTIKSAFKPDYVMTTVDEENHSAMKMYKKLGFKESHSYVHTYFSKD